MDSLQSNIVLERVLGIDVGIATCGWAVLEKSTIANKIKVIDYGAAITIPTELTHHRLNNLFTQIDSIIVKYQPTIVAVESLFFFKNQKTVIGVAQARGVVLLAASRNTLNVVDYTPLQVKTAVTGYGRADKAQIQKMVKLILGLQETPKPDDVADAVAIAICHLNTNKNIY